MREGAIGAILVGSIVRLGQEFYHAILYDDVVAGRQV